MRSNFFLGVGVGVAGTFAGKNLLRAKYYVDTIPQKRQISWAIIYPLCDIKSPLDADVPDKLNFCDSSLTIQMKVSEQSFHIVLFVLQHFARNLEFSSKFYFGYFGSESQD